MGILDGLTFEEVKNKYPEVYKKRGENIARIYSHKWRIIYGMPAKGNYGFQSYN